MGPSFSADLRSAVVATDRRLAWDALLNVRDLGGLPAGDRTIRRAVLVRASALGSMSETGRATLRAHGIRTVIDIRSADEIAERPSPFADGMEYRHVHFLHGSTRGLRRAAKDGAMSAELRMLAEPTSGLADVLAALADAQPGIVLHCVAGRDRTGFVVAVLLAALGVSNGDIIADYVASDAELADEYERFIAEHPEYEADIREAVVHRVHSMETVLETLRADYGDASAYLRAAGVPDAQIERLRAKLLG